MAVTIFSPLAARHPCDLYVFVCVTCMSSYVCTDALAHRETYAQNQGGKVPWGRTLFPLSSGSHQLGRCHHVWKDPLLFYAALLYSRQTGIGSKECLVGRGSLEMGAV